MKLYLFTMQTFLGKVKIKMEELEARETSKLYITNFRRFDKRNVGKTSGCCDNECLLLEINMKKAAEIFMKQKEYELELAENKVADKRAEINNLRKYINDD